MAKVFKFALSATSRLASNNSQSLLAAQRCAPKLSRNVFAAYHSSLSPASSKYFKANTHTHKSVSAACFSKPQISSYSTEVDKEISKFLAKEIQFENSRSAGALPKIPDFDIKTDGGDITLTKTANSEKVVVRLSVNGAVDSIMAEGTQEKEDEPPQMVCRPPFEVEISKGDGTVLALQCTFPVQDAAFEETGQEGDAIDDQFEIQEVAIHGGEWTDTTFSVSAATMDAELFDLLMDMLDERGINDEFINHLVDFCTAYENKQYIGFLQSLKAFAEK